MRIIDRPFRLAAGAALLVAVASTTSLGADKPAPPAAAPPTCDRHGDIDLAKVNERAAKVFADVDTDGNGKITEAEFMAAKPPQHHWMGMGGPGMGGPGMGMAGPGMGSGMSGTGGPGMMGGPGMDGPHMMFHGCGASPQDCEARVKAFETELFTALDTDHNGQLSPDEFSKAHEVTMNLMKKQMFVRLDKNGDGVLTKDEFPLFAARLAEKDTNGDGKVTPEERRAAKGAQPPAPPPAPKN
jgi:Ca2+-binding EF-hand superfamily protein